MRLVALTLAVLGLVVATILALLWLIGLAVNHILKRKLF